MTAAALANSVGVSRPTVWSWETARSQPRHRHLIAIAAALDVNEWEVLGTAANEKATLLRRQQGKPSACESDADALTDVIRRAKDEIAQCAGIEPKMVRILIEV